MGNRAVITIKEDNVPKEQWNSLYLHWNGGRDQVLQYRKLNRNILFHTI